jgi:hypothetical protein
MKRREFITSLVGAAVPPLLWSFVAGAQQAARPARIGLLAFGQPRDSSLFE